MGHGSVEDSHPAGSGAGHRGTLRGVAVACRDDGDQRANAGGQFDDKVDGYVALIPSVLRAGETASFSLTLTNGDKPARSHVTVAVLNKDTTVAEGTAQIDGTGTVAFALPEVEPGEYSVKVSSTHFSKTTKVQVQAGTLLFLETDKPIYKPGQTIHIRLLTLDPELKPVATSGDGGGAGRQGHQGLQEGGDHRRVRHGHPGPAALHRAQPRHVEAHRRRRGKRTTQLDVRVEHYVLPKYEVKVELPKDWFLVNETIKGTVTAKYSYGKPVKGELKIIASRYVGTWEEYATFTADIDGNGEFTIDPPSATSPACPRPAARATSARHHGRRRSPPATRRRPPSC